MSISYYSLSIQHPPGVGLIITHQGLATPEGRREMVRAYGPEWERLRGERLMQEEMTVEELLLEGGDGLAWPYYAKELTALSRRYPTWRFVLYGETENEGLWVHYFQNGYDQWGEGLVQYPPFRPPNTPGVQ